jgi:hypothetical protein
MKWRSLRWFCMKLNSMCVFFFPSSWTFVLISYCAYLDVYVWDATENRPRNKFTGPVASAKPYKLVRQLGRQFMAGYAARFSIRADRLISVSFASF